MRNVRMKQILLTEDDIVFLTITSWRGISPGAAHFYGRLRSKTNLDFKDVVRIIDQVTANRMNKAENTTSYHLGDKVSAFDDIESLIRAARQQFRQYQKDAKVLVLGDKGTVEPQKILVGPREFKMKINRLAQRAEKIGFWDDEEQMDEICKLWEEIWPIKHTRF